MPTPIKGPLPTFGSTSTTRHLCAGVEAHRCVPGEGLAAQPLPSPGARREGGLRLRGILKQPARASDRAGAAGDERAAEPLVSVITVSRNAAETIEATIRSVLAQSHANLEYLVFDGASNDGTADIIQAFDDHIDYWVSEPDGGIYEAMNAAVARARGDWIYFLGADDVLLDSLHRLLDGVPLTGVLCYGDVRQKHSGRVYNGAFSRFDLAVRNICQQAILYPREVFEQRRFDTRYRLFADYAFNMELFASRRVRFQYRPVLVSVYDDTGASTRHDVDPVFLSDRHRLVRSQFGLPIYIGYRFGHAVTRVRRWLFGQSGYRKDQPSLE